MWYFQTWEAPIGKLYLLANDEALHAVAFDSNWPRIRAAVLPRIEQDTPLLAETRQQLADYFAGKRRAFDLPLHLKGTTFQQQIWRSLIDIPYGETRTYAEQANALGKPLAIRAVGHTNGLNPLCIIIPCHRVIAKSGQLTGYAGGLEAKRYLLELESAQGHLLAV